MVDLKDLVVQKKHHTLVKNSTNLSEVFRNRILKWWRFHLSPTGGFKELAKMDEELKLKLQRDREELLRQMEAAVGCVI